MLPTIMGAEVNPEAQAQRLVRGALVLNTLLLAAAVAVYLATRSQLVLAQGSDSMLDIGAGSILALSAWVGSRPGDENHPFGHGRAEPIGALVTAVLAGVLAFEVFRSALGALLLGEEARMDHWVAAVLGGKFVLKLGLFGLIHGVRANHSGAALHALVVDTRNDLVACSSSLVGYGLARAGHAWADGALAIPVAGFIAWGGLGLARENLRYLMGEAPEDGILEELGALAAAVPGVLRVGRVRAQYAGPTLQVDVCIVVPAGRLVEEAHDLSVAVQRALEADERVELAFVHVDTELDAEHH